MLSVHGDFQLTQDSLALWLTDLDVLLTNLEHLSEAPSSEKIRRLEVRLADPRLSECAWSLGNERGNSRKANEDRIRANLRKLSSQQDSGRARFNDQHE